MWNLELIASRYVEINPREKKFGAKTSARENLFERGSRLSGYPHFYYVYVQQWRGFFFRSSLPNLRLLFHIQQQISTASSHNHFYFYTSKTCHRGRDWTIFTWIRGPGSWPHFQADFMTGPWQYLTIGKWIRPSHIPVNIGQSLYTT